MTKTISRGTALVSAVLQVVGVALFIYGAFLLAPFAGFLVCGLAAFLIGWSLEGRVSNAAEAPDRA